MKILASPEINKLISYFLYIQIKFSFVSKLGQFLYNSLNDNNAKTVKSWRRRKFQHEKRLCFEPKIKNVDLSRRKSRNIHSMK